MRGKVNTRYLLPLWAGITPAYAGKRPVVFVTNILVRDHPRLCGEKNFEADGGGILLGSPPPMRGKEIYPLMVGYDRWITPAYAGKRLKRSQNSVLFPSACFIFI